MGTTKEKTRLSRKCYLLWFSYFIFRIHFPNQRQHFLPCFPLVYDVVRKRSERTSDTKWKTEDRILAVKWLKEKDRNSPDQRFHFLFIVGYEILFTFSLSEH